jgi:hypothetical protein
VNNQIYFVMQFTFNIAAFALWLPFLLLLLLPLLVVVLPTTTTVVVEALQEYRNRIPNGNSVPNPLVKGSVWAGVGHFAAGGGGPRNPFGEDFAAAGYDWTTELCMLDSGKYIVWNRPVR